MWGGDAGSAIAIAVGIVEVSEFGVADGVSVECFDSVSKFVGIAIIRRSPTICGDTDTWSSLPSVAHSMSAVVCCTFLDSVVSTDAVIIL